MEMDVDGTVRMRMQDREWRVERMEAEDVSSPSTILILSSLNILIPFSSFLRERSWLNNYGGLMNSFF